MLDSKYLRNHLQEIAKKLQTRGYVLDSERLQSLEAQRKLEQVSAQQLQAQRNQLAKAMGLAKAKGEEGTQFAEEAKRVKIECEQAEIQLKAIQQQLEALYLAIPNLPHASVPEGQNESQNQVIRQWGTPPSFDFTPKDHVLDFEMASKISGARFVVLYGQLAKLQRALTQFCACPNASLSRALCSIYRQR